MNWTEIFGGLSDEALAEAASALKSHDASADAGIPEPEAADESVAASGVENDPRMAVLEAQNRALMEQLRDKESAEASAKSEAVLSASRAWADGLAAGGKILPTQAEAFAAFHATLSGLAEGSDVSIDSFEMKADGSEPDKLSVVAFVEKFMGDKEAHGWNKEYAQSATKVVSNRHATPTHNNKTSGDTNLLSDEDIASMVDVALG